MMNEKRAREKIEQERKRRGDRKMREKVREDECYEKGETTRIIEDKTRFNENDASNL